MAIGLVINPGAGPVSNASEEIARANLPLLIADAGLAVAEVTIGEPTDENDGRWRYTLRLGERRCEVSMPGLPPERVRYLGTPEQNIWHYPRLYVDGDSWVWKCAVPIVRRCLTGDEREE